jgi:hypothetical protein
MDLRTEAVNGRLLPVVVAFLAVIAMGWTAQPRPAAAQQSESAPSEEVLPTPQPKATPPRAAAKKSVETDQPAGAPAAATPAPGCAYLGRRVVQSLLRDDAVTAGDFERVYRTFSCPGEHLRTAFDCTVAAPLPANANEVSARVDACWADPKFDSKAAAAPASGATTAPSAKGEGKGDSKGEAKSDAKGESRGSETKGQPKAATSGKSNGSTPNYTNSSQAPKGQ